MARFRAMPPDKQKVGETRAAEPQTCGDIAQRDVIPPIHPGTDMARYERLGQVKIRGVSRRFSEPALLTARRLRCRMPEPAVSTDLDSTGRIARYVAMEAQRTGELNYKRIFRRAAVDRYLKHQSRRFTIRTMRTLQGQLYEAGRVVHPQEFPRRQALQAPHVRRTGAASLTDIDDAYALAPTLPSALGRQLMVLLDLCYGAGARAADLKVLRGTSILETTWDNEPVAVVYLPNLAGGSRQVPVVDQARRIPWVPLPFRLRGWGGRAQRRQSRVRASDQPRAQTTERNGVTQSVACRVGHPGSRRAHAPTRRRGNRPNPVRPTRQPAPLRPHARHRPHQGVPLMISEFRPTYRLNDDYFR